MNSTVWAVSLPLAAVIISIALKIIKPRTMLNGCKEKFAHIDLIIEMLDKRQNAVDVGIAEIKVRIENIAEDVKEIKTTIAEIGKKVKY